MNKESERKLNKLMHTSWPIKKGKVKGKTMIDFYVLIVLIRNVLAVGNRIDQIKSKANWQRLKTLYLDGMISDHATIHSSSADQAKQCVFNL